MKASQMKEIFSAPSVSHIDLARASGKRTDHSRRVVTSMQKAKQIKPLVTEKRPHPITGAMQEHLMVDQYDVNAVFARLNPVKLAHFVNDNSDFYSQLKHSEQPEASTTANSLNINSLEQAELYIRKNLNVMISQSGKECVDDESLFNAYGFNLTSKTLAQACKRQIEKHKLINGIDFTTSMLQSCGGRPKTKLHFSINAANHILLGAMTPQGKVARQKAIDLAMAQKKTTPLADPILIKSAEPVQAEPNSLESYKQVLPVYKDALEIAKAIGSEINPLAAQITKKMTGVDLNNLFDTPKPSATVTRIKPDAHQSELKLVPKNDQDPRLLGYKRKVTQTYSRTTLRDKGIYGLDNYKSWYELQDVCDMSSKEIREHFVELGLIKLCERGAFSESKKYILTANGWDFGTMYDPVRDEFHGADSKRLLTSDAQPVFGYEVLDLLI